MFTTNLLQYLYVYKLLCSGLMFTSLWAVIQNHIWQNVIYVHFVPYPSLCLPFSAYASVFFLHCELL